MQKTLCIIKPDAVKKHCIGKITDKIETSGLRIVAAKMLRLTQEQARQFYFIHRDRPFYDDLVNFMTSGPIFVQVLQGDNAVTRYRELMGATNPSEAEAGTIRAEFAESIEANAVHGSDSLENAATEIHFFFKPEDICELA